MKVLVLGGTRFIGRAIVQRLLREGHKVTLLNRGLSSDPFGTRVRRILGDRRNHETIVSAADKRDYDAVIDITAYHETETATVAETFRGRVGHFIHISTVSVYLIRENIFPPYREDQFAGPIEKMRKSEESSWFYSFHKRRCEEALEQARQEHGFPYTSYRLPMVVGPHDYTARADAYLGRLLSGGPIILPEGGLNTWGFLWVEDVAEVVVSNLGNQASIGRAYNLAQHEALSLRQLVVTAAAMLGLQPQLISLPSDWLEAVGVGTNFSPYSHDQDILLDCRRAERDLLFKPTPAATWIEELVKDFRQRWDGVLRAFAATRSYELSLVQELNKIRLPAFNVRQ